MANDSSLYFHTTEARKLWQDKLDDITGSARTHYYDTTFSIMVEMRTREGNHICLPIILAVEEPLNSIIDSMQQMFAVAGEISLEVVWEGSGIHFATVKRDNELAEVNTFGVLRLLQQRGGVDKLVATEVVDA